MIVFFQAIISLFRFFVLVLIYLVGGILFLRFARGARGSEQIPNYEFWREFPNYVRVSFCPLALKYTSIKIFISQGYFPYLDTNMKALHLY